MITDRLKKSRIHYAWFILIMACFFYFSTMGVANCAGLFYPRICEEMGWPLSKYTVCTIVQGLFSFLAITFGGKMYAVYPTKKLLFEATLLLGLSHMLKGAMSSILGFCIQGALYGAASGMLLFVPMPMLINNWFIEKRSTALGIALLSSGVGGAIFSPIFTAIMDTWGWRAASYIGGAITLVIAIPFILIVTVKKPSDIGMLPYGAVPENEQEKASAAASSVERSKTSGTGKANAQKSPNYYIYDDAKKNRLSILCFIIAILVLQITVITQQLANYAAVNGISTVVGGYMLSAAMIGNLSSKAALGVFCDKFGERKAYVTAMTLIGIGLLIMTFTPKSTVLLYFASALLGMGGATNTMTVPSILATFTKDDEYSTRLARTSMGTGIASIFATASLSGLYDLFGSYRPVMLTLIVLQIAAITLVFICTPGKKKAA